MPPLVSPKTSTSFSEKRLVLVMDMLGSENQARFINKGKELVLNLDLTGLSLFIRNTRSLGMGLRAGRICKDTILVRSVAILCVPVHSECVKEGVLSACLTLWGGLHGRP